MTVYLIATILSMVTATVVSNLKITNDSTPSVIVNRKFFILLSFLPLTLVAMLRHEVGTDWPIYYHHFYSINNDGLLFKETGFNLLNRLIYLFTDNYAVMAAFVALVSCIFFFKAIYQQSDNYALSILLWVLTATYFTMLNQQRQMLAMSIFFYACRYIKEQKFVPFLLWCLLALCFHTSVILVIPVYFLYKINIRIQTQIILTIAGVFMWYPLNKVALLLFSQSSYGWYLDSAYNQNNFYLIGYIYSVLVLCIYYFLYLCNSNQTDLGCNMALKMQWISVILLMFSTSIPQVSRAGVYFSSIVILTLPTMLLRERNHVRRSIYLLIIASFFAAKLFYDIYSNGWYNVLPYQTFFQK